MGVWEPHSRRASQCSLVGVKTMGHTMGGNFMADRRRANELTPPPCISSFLRAFSHGVPVQQTSTRQPRPVHSPLPYFSSGLKKPLKLSPALTILPSCTVTSAAHEYQATTASTQPFAVRDFGGGRHTTTHTSNGHAHTRLAPGACLSEGVDRSEKKLCGRWVTRTFTSLCAEC